MPPEPPPLAPPLALTATDWIARDRRHVWHPYTQAQTAPDPILIQRGAGALLFGDDGREYLDLISSWWVTTHGHAHPAMSGAIARQAVELEQVIFAGFTHRPAVALATALIAHLPAPLTRVFYTDNGSTAVEAAMKMASQYWRNRGETRHRFLVLEGGYHGDTVGAMSASRSSGFFDAFAPMLFQVDSIPYPATWLDDETVEARENASLLALSAWLEEHGDTAVAVLAEPLIQGAAGMRVCRPWFLRQFAEMVAEAGVLLILDEVMTGFGRTGAMFACQKAGITPDILCLAKGLSGGFLPLAATVCREEIYEAFCGESFDRAFAHGHSFTANPLGCAAGLASLELFAQEGTLARIAAMEAIHRERILAVAGHPKVRRPRVLGTMAALEIGDGQGRYDTPIGRQLQAFFLERGMLVRPLGSVLYLLPPYCITHVDLHRAWDGIEEAIRKVG